MKIKIVGILNVTPDSFSDGGNFLNPDIAVKHTIQLFEEGADIVDIGAVSTSYGAVLLGHEEEWNRLKPVLDKIDNSYRKNISIDTFHPETAKKSIEMGVGMINDVSGGKNSSMLEIISRVPNVKYVIMCNKGLPANKKIRYENMQEIYNFAEVVIKKAKSYGILKEQLIFDPGIGFATGPDLSFKVIKNIDYYNQLKVPIYIGHSRKSFLEEISELPPYKRDIETLTASIYMAMQGGVSYLRVHNVKMHSKALNVLKVLKDGI